jgi:hypothetical protein
MGQGTGLKMVKRIKRAVISHQLAVSGYRARRQRTTAAAVHWALPIFYFRSTICDVAEIGDGRWEMGDGAEQPNIER